MGSQNYLQPAQVSLSGVDGESLEVKGAVSLEFKLGEGLYDQLTHVGKLEGLDLLLGMDWLSSYGVTIGCS